MTFNATPPTQNYTYDQENRLLSTAGATYTYDGNGERVLKSNTSTGAAVKRYWSMGGNMLAEGDSSGNLTAEYIYFGGKRIARIDLPANTVHYYLSDHLGSTSIVASAAGVVEEESDYYPFGTEVIVTGPGANELKFTGKRRDTESQLDYFGARYYSNGFGRFASIDPRPAISFQQARDEKSVKHFQKMIENPQSWNLYAYAYDNPLRFADPTGETVITNEKEANKEVSNRKLDDQRKQLTQYGRDLDKQVKAGKLDPSKAIDKFYQRASELTANTKDPKSNALLISAASSFDIRGNADIGDFGSSDSTHHFFFAAFNAYDNIGPAVGAAMIADLAEGLAPSSDWESDMLANDSGAFFGSDVYWSTSNPLEPSKFVKQWKEIKANANGPDMWGPIQ